MAADSGATHISVMPEEVLGQWITDPAGVYVDATVGLGGHSALALSRYPHLRVLGLDQDPEALALARERLAAFADRVTLVQGNFREMDRLAAGAGVAAAAGILLDLGVSSLQLDRPERGFSYQEPALEAPLDMRMDPSAPVDAATLLNTAPEAEIARVLWAYGEERWARRIAAFVAEARRRRPLRTAGDLVAVVKAAVPAGARRHGGHPARRTFQALRIWVNDELGALAGGLEAGWQLLAPGGHLVVLTFHSLEDRLVKHTFREWAAAGRGSVLLRRPLTPGPEEVAANRRARSAKLRAFVRTGALDQGEGT
ncbi:16S rRNA m4C1402 methyltransferase [Candidatus Hydrogenisulfobacillus filiaventi]|uniref:Ribosomal RNA small subunit methyltransferase H n=1 Tax=Candidatus Hydrogenisulfobacillus filiaventi TaxID=2707344 RepID=A0A6F8ZF13_9FIRM|nr:16S rRNA (cytosine(1402)-N(4))-methyltransferase RsmH [Bacillota bacterium]CAB1128458.1 16S rRNA m4C1402 methyltransferase [Candidatus Hydrogenisulfobacillus filiaventi]